MKTFTNKTNHLINGQYYINLNQWVDIDGLQKLYDDLTLNIVLLKDQWESGSINQHELMYDSKFYEPKIYLEKYFKFSEEYKLLSEKYSDNVLEEYCKFKFNLNYIQSNRLFLRNFRSSNSDIYNKFYGAKHLAKLNKNTVAYPYFENFHGWLKDQNIFSEIGREVIFINEKNTCLPTHSDYIDKFSYKDQFIWVNIFNKKKFYVLDANMKKVHLNGDVILFDNSNWHGGDPVDYACYSIRIDGVFQEDFLHRTGLYNYFKE